MKTIFSIFAIILLTGCQQGILTKYSLVPIAHPQGPTMAILSKGQIVAVQRQFHTVSVYVKHGQADDGMQADIYVSVTNEGDEPITFKPSNVSFSIQAKEDNRRLLALTSNEVISDIKRAYDHEASVRILMGALQAAAASYANSYSYETGLVSGMVGGRPVTGSYSARIATPEAAQNASNQIADNTERTIANLYAERDRTIARLKSELLSETEVMPYETYIGMLRTRPDKTLSKFETLFVHVQFDDVIHSFQFNIVSNTY